MDESMEIVNIKSVVCVYCGLAIGHDIAPTEAGVAAIRDLMCKHDAVCESNPLVAHIATLERDLAAAQAEVVEAHGIIQWMSGSKSFGPGGEAHEGWVKAREALSRPPGSLSALEAMLLQVAGCVWAAAAPSVEMDSRECAAIVSRILGKEAAR